MTPLERAAQDRMQRSLQLSDERMVQMRIAVTSASHQRPRLQGRFIRWEPLPPGMIDAALAEEG